MFSFGVEEMESNGFVHLLSCPALIIIELLLVFRDSRCGFIVMVMCSVSVDSNWPVFNCLFSLFLF